MIIDASMAVSIPVYADSVLLRPLLIFVDWESTVSSRALCAEARTMMYDGGCFAGLKLTVTDTLDCTGQAIKVVLIVADYRCE